MIHSLKFGQSTFTPFTPWSSPVLDSTRLPIRPRRRRKCDAKLLLKLLERRERRSKRTGMRGFLSGSAEVFLPPPPWRGR